VCTNTPTRLITETFTGIRPMPLDFSHHIYKRDRRDRRDRRNHVDYPDYPDHPDRRNGLDRRDRLVARTLEITLQVLLIVVVVGGGIGLFLTKCSLG